VTRGVIAGIGRERRQSCRQLRDAKMRESAGGGGCEERREKKMIAKELISELEKIHERYIPENNQRLNSANI
jgi:hypothetical protein